MEPKYLIAQGVGFAAAAASIAWVVAVHRVRYLPAIVGWMALMVVSFVVVFGYELVPRDSPALFAAMLGWITIGFIAGLFALIAVLQRRFAVGWLTFVDDRTLRVQGNGSEETIVCTGRRFCRWVRPYVATEPG